MAQDPEEALPTARFRRQHAELFELAQELLAIRDPEAVRADATNVRLRMARFLGKLRVHAAMENDAMYPRLLKDPDPRIQETARRLFTDVGPIYDEVFAYADRWPTAAAVAADPTTFVQETKKVLRRLGERVTLETMELYPLVDERGLT
ncbi:MAG: hemerythrin domain-containing protein [Myxococcota bacterium]